MRLKRALPKPGDRQEKFLDQWLARRAALEHGNLHLLGFSLRTFVENFNGKPALFALQPANNVDPSAGWLLMRFDLPSVRDNRIRPLLQAFIKEQGGSIQLQGPEDPWDDDALNWPVGQVLPGWLLVYKPNPAAQQQQVDRGSTLILVELGGSLLAIVLAIFSGWREVRREHAMIDLRNRFVANVSHELKTPLTLIRMYAETLYLGRITDASKQHQYHRTILREAERLTRMITAVLDFGRLNQGINVYQLTDEDLGETVEQVLVRYAFRIEEADMCLETQLEQDLPAVPHDRNGVTQILLNLIDNAIKYGASGGKLLVTLRRKGNGVELAVTDYGPGIPVSKHGKAVRDVDAANASGSGLGLALVEQIVKAHHAQLKFEVPDGAGTRASITFATGSQA